MRIIHVQVGFRPNLPEVSTRNLLFAAIKSSPQHQCLFQGAAGATHAAVAQCVSTSNHAIFMIGSAYYGNT
jgi:hypothetical protein